MAKLDQDDWFAREVHPHETQLRTYLRKQFPTLKDVDDIVQESYAKLLKSGIEKQIESPKALLFTIARNTVYDIFRRNKVVGFESLTQIPDSSVLDTKTSIEETVSLRDEIDLLIQAVETLPKRCRQVVTLRMVYGYSHKEIGKELEISVHTVKAQLAKGMRNCATFFAKQKVK